MKKLSELIQNEELLITLTEEQMETVKGGTGMDELYQ
jgi:hypothetical protein